MNMDKKCYKNCLRILIILQPFTH
ncbi:hypothetical protein Godav_004911 [Gossypium davidsonii]|uniref:Uncharacterized protein n=1 Tax=Gossypium davidsonii TaxID=34287 RepID=A0A7J8SP67_GOSDV|nr:hypothetical protein [Gossypium davidsonii]